jgi:hypothetical protein
MYAFQISEELLVILTEVFYGFLPSFQVNAAIYSVLWPEPPPSKFQLTRRSSSSYCAVRYVSMSFLNLRTDQNHSLLGFNFMYFDGWVPEFRRNVFPSSAECKGKNRGKNWWRFTEELARARASSVPMAQKKVLWNFQGIFKHRVIQERRSIYCKVIISDIVRKKMHLKMRLILNGYRHRSVWIHKHKSIVIAYKEKLLIGNFILILISI